MKRCPSGLTGPDVTIKGAMALCFRTIGIARARVKIGLANLTYNIRRLVFQERNDATA